ncbi:MAG: membrane dipeptidase [Firmicutes bacterium]|nr:membrane dipeptidase [Bacillota bacterium]
MVAEGAAAFHRRCLVVDAHCDTALRLAAGASLASQRPEGHVDLDRLAAGGVDVQVFALWADARERRSGLTVRCLDLLDAVWREMERWSDKLHPILTAADLEEAQASAKIGVLLSIEGGEALEGSLSALRAFYRLGVRAMGLTWNGRNDLADGVGEAATGGGLTSFGRQVVKEMERLGMVVDVSHLAEAGFWHVLEIYPGPVIASHSNARAVCDHPRNLTDRQIRALAGTGGVMGINFCPDFLRAGGGATLDDVVRHIDHIVGLVGPDHVGIGSDYDGIDSTPAGLEDVSRLPALTEALLRRGYGEKAVAAILGGNFARVFRQVLP